MSGYLELADGGLVAVRDGLVLGRVASCDVVLDDTKASRRHARVIVEAGVVEIEDMGSSNGTRLNGKPVERRMLRDGDRVEIGKTAVVFREGALPVGGAAGGGRGSVGRGSVGAPSAPAPAAADPFGDDDDLLGGGSPSSAPPLPDAPGGLEDEDDLLASTPSPAGDVVEFEDEVVEVTSAPPPRRADPLEDPLVAPRAPSRPAGAPASKSGQQAAGQERAGLPGSGRVLQYSKKAGGKGVLGDDLGQMSGGKRALLVVLVLAVGGCVVYGIMAAMR